MRLLYSSAVTTNASLKKTPLSSHQRCGCYLCCQSSQEINNVSRKWEHQMKRWMEAYESGLGAKDAQFQVKAFSSKTQIPQMHS
ncbi:hypothetical protein F4604DRAFT_965403 [Suillus subluteus]|nr:hypothetical protein F4604DRAFT_965403 [Suillus subluteus]